MHKSQTVRRFCVSRPCEPCQQADHTTPTYMSPPLSRHPSDSTPHSPVTHHTITSHYMYCSAVHLWPAIIGITSSETGSTGEERYELLRQAACAIFLITCHHCMYKLLSLILFVY